MSADLIDIFHAGKGIVCFVGAGGKKTTIYRLAAGHPGRAGITATAHIEYFPKKLDAARYIASEEELFRLVERDRESRVVAFARPSRRHGRRAGISPEHVDQIRVRGRFDVLLIKADGARSRWMKAPAGHEPPLPDCADTVIPVVSARVFGKALTTKIAHRTERICAVTGMKENESVLPVHVARLLASPEGALKNTTRATVIPLINMVDDTALEEPARQAARQALDLTDRFDQVILAAMREKDPIRDIVCR